MGVRKSISEEILKQSVNDGGKKTGLVKTGKEYSRPKVQRPQDGSKIEGCRNSEKGPVD